MYTIIITFTKTQILHVKWKYIAWAPQCCTDVQLKSRKEIHGRIDWDTNFSGDSRFNTLMQYRHKMWVRDMTPTFSPLERCDLLLSISLSLSLSLSHSPPTFNTHSWKQQVHRRLSMPGKYTKSLTQSKDRLSKGWYRKGLLPQFIVK